VSAAVVRETFQLAVEARAKERRAFEEYGGYSWGYVGAYLIEAAQKAESTADDALTKFVDARIAAALHALTVKNDLDQFVTNCAA